MDQFSKRSGIVIAIFVFIGLVYAICLFYLQILNPAYKQFATNNVLREVVQYPARGLIYDRNGKLMVINKPSYELFITPREVKDFDTLYLCQLVDITKEELETKIREAKNYSWYKPSMIAKQISPENYAILQEQIFKFKGFHTQLRTLREYETLSAAHALGYVGEVTQSDLTRDNYYGVGDYIGVSGIEKSYENYLRGEKGLKKFMVDVHNRIQGSYLDGTEDVPAKIGKNLVSTIDLDLQIYAEELLKNKKGAVVAIEPSTGEILVMASTPSYSPGMLVGRERGNNYAKLLADTLSPLFDRALLGEYPPGSTFKMLNAMIALQEQSITLYTRFPCSGPESSPIRCTHYHSSMLGVVEAIMESCNPFMWNAFRTIITKYPTAAEGYNVWREYVLSFGIGRKLNSDISNENQGNIPTDEFYNRRYGERRWNAQTIRSLAIGQGEIGMTPLQLANYTAILANRGWYFIPHVIKDIENDEIDQRFTTKTYTKISPENFEPAITGMQRMVESTSSAALIIIPEIEMCGKTGTAQNPHGRDHSIFIAFAPKDNPQIAIAVYVENAGFGAAYAAPIASLIVEKYIKKEIAENRKWIEQRMLEADLLRIY